MGTDESYLFLPKELQHYFGKTFSLTNQMQFNFSNLAYFFCTNHQNCQKFDNNTDTVLLKMIFS